MPKTPTSKLKFFNSSKFITFRDCLLYSLWAIGGFMAVQYLISYLFVLIFDNAFLRSTLCNCLASLLIGIVSILVIVFIPHKFFKKWRTSREELGLNGLPTWTDLGLAPVAYIASIIISYLLTALFSLLPWFNINEAQNIGLNGSLMTDFDKIIGYFTVAVIAPILEEIIFRGWLYGKLRSKISMIPAMLITSLIFAVCHGQWNVGVDTFAVSMVLCALREITGTIYSGAMVHIIKNSVAYYLVYILMLA